MHITSDPAEAAEALRRGHLVGLPTETVYGLAALASDATAVSRIFTTKGRPTGHPLIVHIGDPADLPSWASRVPEWVGPLTDAFWPGPLTIVLNRGASAGDAVTGGLPTVGIRMPAHPQALEVLQRLRDTHAAPGIAAPSANRFGRVSPTTSHAVIAELAPYAHDGDLVLEGGPCTVGIESTIVDATSALPRLLRPGAITVEQISAVTGMVVLQPDGTVHAPGMLASHYAPDARVHLISRSQDIASAIASLSNDESVTVLRFGPDANMDAVETLAHPASLQAYAVGLYGWLREADTRGFAHIIAVLPPATGIGSAIRDRLERAAHR